MEAAVMGLRDALSRLGDVTQVNTSVSTTNRDRGLISIEKVRAVRRQRSLLRGASRRSSASRPGAALVAHLPISQNASGLVRDIALADKLPVTYLAYLHGSAYDRILAEQSLRSVLLRRLLSSAAGIACLYEGQVRELAHRGVTTPAATVGNCLSAGWLAAASKAQRRSRPDSQPYPFRLLFIGHLSRAKGFDVLLKAVATLPGFRLTAIGEWIFKDRSALHLGSMRQPPVPPNVTLLPPAEPSAIARLMTEHDALILPSLSEGLPMTVLEAMSIGLPVIAARTGGLPTLLDDNRGMLIEQVGVPGVCQAVQRCRAEYRSALEAARRAHAYVGDHYSAEAVAARLSSLITVACAAPHNRALS
jgi:glycosyltransferase involved in cell wall biosynthesis